MSDQTPTDPALAAYTAAMLEYTRSVQAMIAEMRADRVAAADRFERRLAQDDRNERLRADSMRDHTAAMVRAMAGEPALPEPVEPVKVPLPAPAPAPTTMRKPPVDLVQSQAERYLAMFLAEFAKVGITTWMQAAQHWRDYGRAEWINGDPNRRKFTP